MILKADQLRKGTIVIDSKNKQRWFVKDIGEFITLRDVDPPIETDGAPVYFRTTWRIRPSSDLMFLLIEE